VLGVGGQPRLHGFAYGTDLIQRRGVEVGPAEVVDLGVEGRRSEEGRVKKVKGCDPGGSAYLGVQPVDVVAPLGEVQELKEERRSPVIHQLCYHCGQEKPTPDSLWVLVLPVSETSVSIAQQSVFS